MPSKLHPKKKKRKKERKNRIDYSYSLVLFSKLINHLKRACENAAKTRKRKSRKTRRKENFNLLKRKSVDTNTDPVNKVQFDEKDNSFCNKTFDSIGLHIFCLDKNKQN